MGLAPGFDFDVFVSYAHADNVSSDGPQGWVSQLVRHLEAALRQRLGGGESLKVFFDNRTTAANYQLTEFVNAARESAVFVAVASPCYTARDWPRRELESFFAGTQDRSRVFMVECLPLNKGERYPSPLDEHVPLTFWKPTGPRQIPMPISPTVDASEFSTLVHSLASDIREKLLLMCHTTGVAQTGVMRGRTERSLPAAAPNEDHRLTVVDPKRTILLAQTTDDVADDADQLMRYLNQFSDEVAVLPKASYSQGGEAFMSAFRRDLAHAGLFVQLLGKRIGRIPPDLPQGYTRFQLEAAKAAGLEIMQWRHPDLEPNSVGDPMYQGMLTAETVVASGFEAFKNQVLNWARKRSPVLRKARCRSQLPTVFINADRNDLTIAQEIQRECLLRELTTFLPICGASSEASRKDLEENLTDCDVLLFIYGDTTQDWIRSQLRFFGKVKPRRDSEPKLLAICSGPPAQKPDIGVTVPNAHIINCPDGWDMASVRNLLAELAA